MQLDELPVDFRHHGVRRGKVAPLGLGREVGGVGGFRRVFLEPCPEADVARIIVGRQQDRVAVFGVGPGLVAFHAPVIALPQRQIGDGASLADAGRSPPGAWIADEHLEQGHGRHRLDALLDLVVAQHDTRLVQQLQRAPRHGQDQMPGLVIRLRHAGMGMKRQLDALAGVMPLKRFEAMVQMDVMAIVEPLAQPTRHLVNAFDHRL